MQVEVAVAEPAGSIEIGVSRAAAAVGQLVATGGTAAELVRHSLHH